MVLLVLEFEFDTDAGAGGERLVIGISLLEQRIFGTQVGEDMDDAAEAERAGQTVTEEHGDGLFRVENLFRTDVGVPGEPTSEIHLDAAADVDGRFMGAAAHHEDVIIFGSEHEDVVIGLYQD